MLLKIKLIRPLTINLKLISLLDQLFNESNLWGGADQLEGQALGHAIGHQLELHVLGA